MAEQATLLGLAKRGPALELAGAPHVVQERRGEQQVRTQAWMKLRGLAAERGHTDRVLEQSPCISVVTVRSRGGESSKRGAHPGVAHERVDDRGEPGMRDLSREELEEAVQLVGVASQRRREGRGVGIVHRLHCADLHLQLPAEPLDAAEHAHRVAFAEPPVQELDVAPYPGLDAAARVCELQGEVGRTGSRPASLLLRDGEHALHGAVLRQLDDRGHGPPVYERGPLVRSRPMADVQPFRAVRYSGAAGPLADLVAPPYDAITNEERDELFGRSPFNVVHVTLPDSADEAARLYHDWLSTGILASDDEPAIWLLVEEYTGPDGVARRRHGVVLSVAAEPYETGSILPHERTHPRIRDERLRLLRATRVQPEPIFLLADGRLELEVPDRPPELDVDGSRLWRLADFDTRPLTGSGLLIADGHHRYESAIQLGSGRPSGARIMALVVSTEDPGLRVFPTHRVFSDRPDLAELHEGEPSESLDEALDLIASEPFARSAAVAYRRGRAELVRGREGELDVELVDRHGLDGIQYTPRADEAVAAVDSGRADVAFLLRDPRVEDVFAVARRGERMPQKSTYFFPKPLSGLLFHPVEP